MLPPKQKEQKELSNVVCGKLVSSSLRREPALKRLPRRIVKVIIPGILEGKQPREPGTGIQKELGNAMS